jgi:uncharacterized protein
VPAPFRPDMLLKQLPRLAGTVALATAGGAGFAAIGMPVPWISGSMITVAAAALIGVPVMVPRWLREIVFFLLGLNIGAAVTPETLGNVLAWPASIALMVVVLPIVSVSCALPLIFWRGWNRDDAMLASVPGALSLILALADATDADVPRVAIVQAVRVVILVAVVPLLISFTGEVATGPMLPQRVLAGPLDFALLAIAGLALTFVIRALRFPAPALFGSLIASAALHATSVVSTSMPGIVLTISFVVLGAGIGARFSGLGWVRFRRGLVDALITFAVGFALSLVAAIVASVWLGFPFGQTVLAFAPGAFEVMVVMAFLLGYDAAYVGAHHTVRFLTLAILAPVIFRKRPGGKAT